MKVTLIDIENGTLVSYNSERVAGTAKTFYCKDFEEAVNKIISLLKEELEDWKRGA